MTSTAEALSGRWAGNVAGWAITSTLASAIVIAQGLTLFRPGAGWITLSVVLQLLVSTLWGAAVVAISRRRYGRVVPLASALLWIGLGVSRGAAGGFVALLAGIDPEWAYHMGFWTLLCLCWMPLTTYALAQWDTHRRLLAVRTGLAVALDAAARRAAESTDERRRRMTRAVDDSLGPALDEIRASLREIRTLDESSVGAMADRLEGLATRTASFTASAPIPVPSRAGRVSINAATNEFELRRPGLAALLAAVSTTPLVLPEAFRDGGWPQLGEYIVAILVSTTLLIGLYRVQRPFLFAGARRSVLTRIGVLAVGILGGVTTIVLPWDHVEPADLVLLVVFPVVFWFAAASTGTAVALNATNVELEVRVESDRAALTELAARVRASEQETAARLETLVRGELNGRVASCALALGLLAEADLSPEARERVVAGVLEQLDAAAAELKTL